MKRSLNPTRRPNKWQQAQRYELIVKNGKNKENHVTRLIIIFLFLFCTSAYSAEINCGNFTVAEIRADWPGTMPNNVFYYIFDGGYLSNTCGEANDDNNLKRYAQSGDSNINKILYTAYVMDLTVKVGIEDKNCVITTARLFSVQK